MNRVKKLLLVTWLWYKDYRRVEKEKSRLWKQRRRLERAMRIADDRAIATGKKQWVLPDHRGRPQVFDKEEIRKLKVFGVFNKRVSMEDFDREALYKTQVSNNKYVKP